MKKRDINRGEKERGERNLKCQKEKGKMREERGKKRRGRTGEEPT